jgi:hypothetical protein
VAYTPDWEPLAHALKRIMKTGASEDEAKIDLCRAVADRKIDVRVRIAANDYGRQGQFFSDHNVGVPPHLSPNDVDWTQSRPLGQWPIGPKLGEHYTSIQGWEKRPLDLIEVSTADVIAVLCSTAGHSSDNEPAVRATKEQRRVKSRPQLERARNAIMALYPNGVPGQAEEPNTMLCRRVGDELKRRNLSNVSDDTILRAAGRRRK